MIGLDTNVLVRYLAQDDPRQSPRATRLIESLPIRAQSGLNRAKTGRFTSSPVSGQYVLLLI